VDASDEKAEEAFQERVRPSHETGERFRLERVERLRGGEIA